MSKRSRKNATESMEESAIDNGLSHDAHIRAYVQHIGAESESIAMESAIAGTLDIALKERKAKESADDNRLAKSLNRMSILELLRKEGTRTSTLFLGGDSESYESFIQIKVKPRDNGYLVYGGMDSSWSTIDIESMTPAHLKRVAFEIQIFAYNHAIINLPNGFSSESIAKGKVLRFIAILNDDESGVRLYSEKSKQGVKSYEAYNLPTMATRAGITLNDLNRIVTRKIVGFRNAWMNGNSPTNALDFGLNLGSLVRSKTQLDNAKRNPIAFMVESAKHDSKQLKKQSTNA